MDCLDASGFRSHALEKDAGRKGALWENGSRTGATYLTRKRLHNLSISTEKNA